jgi:hypothetical protein
MSIVIGKHLLCVMVINRNVEIRHSSPDSMPLCRNFSQ